MLIFVIYLDHMPKNKAKPSSDIDLLIDTKVTGLDYFGLIEELRQALHKK